MPRALLILAVFCSDVVTAWLFGGSIISVAKLPVQLYPARGSLKPYEEVGRPQRFRTAPPHGACAGGFLCFAITTVFVRACCAAAWLA